MSTFVNKSDIKCLPFFSLISPLGSLHLLQSLWGWVGLSPLIWLQTFILFSDYFLLSCAICVNVSAETPYICVVYSGLSPPAPCSFLILITFGVNGSCQWPYLEVVACSFFNIVWGFWKAQWDTEWAPLSLITVHLLKSSGAGLLPISFSYRFFFYVTPMEAAEIIFHGTGLSTRKLLPNDCFYFDFHMMLSILVGLGCPIFFICLAAGQLNRAALVL